MASFLYSSLLWWGLPLVGVPVLIHLINLMRHKRIRWGAMEFLLASQKRHKSSIRFKQFLLLLLRMLAVAAVVLMLAQPMVRNQWGALFGGSRTHHIILLDDSFSMSDRWADTSAFEQAKQVVERLGSQALHQDTAQLFTVVRFSRAPRLSRGNQPDMIQSPVDAQFPARLTEVLGGLSPSETAANPQGALDALDRLPPKNDDEDRIVYIVSDFRANEWNEPGSLLESLQTLDKADTQMHLINCVDEMRPNLAITELKADKGTRAAGVPLLVDVTVHNFGATPARQVSVALEEDGSSRPAIVLDAIPPGKNLTRRFPVLFTTAGEHEVIARLQSDAVMADNSRSLVLEIKNTVDVLVIDGDPRGEDAYFLSAALAPGGKVASGLRPIVQPARYLREQPLDQFATIYLLNIDRLNEAEISALEAYCAAGGGVGIFLGDRSRAEFYNSQLYREGKGIFPLPLTGPAELAIDRLERSPDLEVTDHPIFAVFAGERNTFLSTVVVSRYFAAARDWSPSQGSTAKVIARLRNRAPLAVEQSFGDGRVIAFLTKASPLETTLGSWNNWGRENPSFVVAMQEMQAYLSAARFRDLPREVGAPLDIKIDPARYLPQVQFTLPGIRGTTVAVDAVAGDAGQSAVLTDTDTSGVYQARLTLTDTSEQTLRFALNVAPREGNLARLDGRQLAERLPNVRYQYHKAADITLNAQQLAGINLSEGLLYLLVLILLGEQLLAYACSYHPAPGGSGK